MKITDDLVEDFIAQAILTRLNSSDMERSLIQTKPNPKAQPTHTELSEIDGRFIELAEMVAEGEFARMQYQTAIKVAMERKTPWESTLGRGRGVVALVEGVGSPQIIAQRWKSLDLLRQRAILMSVSERIELDKVTVKGMPFNSNRVRPVWRY